MDSYAEKNGAHLLRKTAAQKMGHRGLLSNYECANGLAATREEKGTLQGQRSETQGAKKQRARLWDGGATTTRVAPSATEDRPSGCRGQSHGEA